MREIEKYKLLSEKNKLDIEKKEYLQYYKYRATSLKFDNVGKYSSSTNLMTANNYQCIISGKFTAINSHLNTSKLLAKNLSPQRVAFINLVHTSTLNQIEYKMKLIAAKHRDS